MRKVWGMQIICVLLTVFCLSNVFSATKLGAVVGDGFVDFSLYSENATRVQLELFEKASDAKPVKSLLLKKGNDSIWKVRVENIGEGVFYGYRCWGPNWPFVESFTPGTEEGFVSDVDKHGNRFNPNKLLIDPYAKSISHDPIGDGNNYRSGENGREFDTAKITSKSIVIDDNAFDWEGDKPLNYDISKCIIYETHVRGLTKHSSIKVSPAIAGTYKGMIKLIPYFKKLGVTSIELLPVHETVNDQNDDKNYGDDNYWGYMTLNYFSPDRRYSSDKSPEGPVREFKEMVKAYHKAGLEIILDVVYNHTGEGGIWQMNGKQVPEFANVLSFRGIDNSTYYQLCDDKRFYYDNTGCGGNVRVTHPYVQRFIRDSLRYWVEEMHVDGFRFDLASVLGNTYDGHGFHYDVNSKLLNDITKDLPKTKMIAEPWAIGGNSYQVGGFPSKWKEWNGKYRDTLRSAVLMSEGSISQFAGRLCGSIELFGHNRRPASYGVNFVTAHDGLTLYDVCAYDHKKNMQKFPYGPSDGGEEHNHSKNWGAEWMRLQQVRNMALALMVSRGTPMMLGGDEFGRTKKGNNNTYNLDSVANWMDWDLMKKNQDLVTFWSRLINFRKSQPALCSPRYPTGKDSSDSDDHLPDIQWHGVSYNSPDWKPTSRVLAYRLDGSKEETGASRDGNDIYLILNFHSDDMNFQLPPNHVNMKWYRMADTAKWAVDSTEISSNFATEKSATRITDGTWTDLSASRFEGNETYNYGVKAHSAVIFIEK